MPETIVSELVIVGRRPPQWPTDNIPPGSIAFQDGYYGIFKNFEDGSLNPDYPQSPTNEPVLAYELDPNTAEAAQLTQLVANAISRVVPRLRGVPEFASVQSRSGPILGTDINSNLDALLRVPVRITYRGGIPGGPGAIVGAAIAYPDPAKPNQPVLYVTPELLMPRNYGDASRYPNNEGMNFVILHEISHLLRPVQTQGNQERMNYQGRTGSQDFSDFERVDPATGEFFHVERRQIEFWANDAALSLGGHINLPVITNPTYGPP